MFNPVTYNIVVGLNTTAGTVLTTLTATDADNDALTYATASTGGAVYFAVDTSTGNANLVLANLLDVEYGGIQWNFKVFVSDSVNIGKNMGTCADPEGERRVLTPPPPLEITSSMGFYRN